MDLMPILLNNKNAVNQLLQRIDYIITDCDGVLWLDSKVIDRSNEFLVKMRALGKKIIFATNNSTKSRATILKKLHSLGFEAKEDEIMVPSYTVCVYLKQKNLKGKVYVFGSSGIEDELKISGLNYEGFGPDPLPRNISDLSQIKLDNNVEAVIVGFDYEISYPKLIRASTYATQVRPDMFIATNKDATLPTPYNNLRVPGTGAFVKAIEVASGRKPVVMGKPEKTFFDCIQAACQDLDPVRTMMIGDRLDTDIAFANNNKLGAALFVESGVSKLKEVEEATQETDKKHLIPTHYASTLGSLLNYI